jgi:ribonuclease HI
MPSFYAIKIGKNPGIYSTWAECKLNIGPSKNAKYKKFDTKQEAQNFINNKSYYAVKVGIKPGIYLTWTECKENIVGFSKAVYKKFNTEQEAKDYLNQKIQLVGNSFDFTKCINIYTDGSCTGNGKKNAIGGYGIYFKENDPRNKSGKMKSSAKYKITNNRAELKAILSAIKIVTKDLDAGKTVIIHTDSKYSILSLTTNTIKNRDPALVPNYDYIIKGTKLVKKYQNLLFHHVLAHTTKQDIHSIGNMNADILAKN